MHMDMDTLLTLLSFIVAVAVIWQLYSVLGKRTGHERPPEDWFMHKPRVTPAAPQRLLEQKELAPQETLPKPFDKQTLTQIAPKGSALYEGLSALLKQDPYFDPSVCKEELKRLYEKIFTAYQAGDRAGLKSLLEAEVFETFTEDFRDGSPQEGPRERCTFVGFKDCHFVAVSCQRHALYITMRFLCEGYKYIEPGARTAGDIREADASKAPASKKEGHFCIFEDVWTFSRPFKNGPVLTKGTKGQGLLADEKAKGGDRQTLYPSRQKIYAASHWLLHETLDPSLALSDTLPLEDKKTLISAL